jgi:outer membrane receptor protein involved in Fe transport
MLKYHLELGNGLNADLWGSYSYIDGEYRSPRQNIDTSPNYIANHKIRLGVTLNIGDRYQVIPQLRINSETDANDVDPDNESERLKVPGYGVMDLGFLARDLFSIRGLNARLDIHNLFDRRYYHAGGQGAPLVFVKQPQATRSWMATLEYNFDF